MRDVDDAGTAGSKPPNDPKKPLDLTVRERCGWFVHHDDARRACQDFRDLDELLLPNRKPGDRHVEWYLQSKFVQRPRRTRSHRGRVDETAVRRFGTKRDVC